MLRNLSLPSLKKGNFTFVKLQVFGSVVQLVRMLPCHGRGRGFESRPVRLMKDYVRVTLFYFYSTLL